MAEHRLRRRVSVVVALLLVGVAAGAEAIGVPDFRAGGTASRHARRSGATQNHTDSPSYVAGRCDDHVGGLGFDASRRRPNRVGLIGRSGAGREIWAEHWGRHDGPQVIVVATVHGNECSPLVFAKMVREHDWQRAGVWLVPMLNPDGYAAFDRENAAGVDLNADGHQRSQPETLWLMQLTAQVQPAVTIHVHSPNGFIGWHGSEVAREVTTQMSAATGLRFTTAGSRSGTNRFLWQGQQDIWIGGGSVLVELPPVTNFEARTAALRARQVSLSELERLSLAGLAALDASVV